MNIDLTSFLGNVDMHNPYFHGAAAAIVLISVVLYWINKSPGEAFQFRYVLSGVIALIAAFGQEAASTTYNATSPYLTAFGAGFMAAGFWWLMTRMGQGAIEDHMDRKNIVDVVQDIAPEVADSMSDDAIEKISVEIKKATNTEDIAKILKKLKLRF